MADSYENELDSESVEGYDDTMKTYNNLAYYNGHYDELENMTIPMGDRVCYFGDGVYDATIAGHGVIHDCDAHIDRFFHSAELLQIVPCISKNDLKVLLYDLLEKVDPSLETLQVYMQFTRGTGVRNHVFPDATVPSNLWIVFSNYGTLNPHRHIDVITYPDKRFEYCNIKTLNLLPSVLASQAAKEAGADEAIFLRPGNIVTECAHNNVSILKNGVFKTHPNDEYILPGIGKTNLIRKCGELGIPVVEEAYTLEELLEADEIIVSCSGCFCMGVDHVDGKPVGGRSKELLLQLQDELMKDYLEEQR